jgi:hypothetical protein
LDLGSSRRGFSPDPGTSSGATVVYGDLAIDGLHDSAGASAEAATMSQTVCEAADSDGLNVLCPTLVRSVPMWLAARFIRHCSILMPGGSWRRALHGVRFFERRVPDVQTMYFRD